MEENCSFWNVFRCMEACRSLYLSIQPAFNFCFQFLHLVFHWRYSTGLEEILLVLLDMLILLDNAGRCFSRERNSVELIPLFLSFESFSHVSSPAQEKPLTSRTCASSSTPAGPRALPSTSARRRTAPGCPTSTTVAPVRAPTTKSTAASSAPGRMSSRRSAPMSSATSPLSPEATWPSRPWRGGPAPTTLTTALCCRYVSRTVSVRCNELSLPVESLWIVALCRLGCTTALTQSERPCTARLGWTIHREALEGRGELLSLLIVSLWYKKANPVVLGVICQ